MRPSVHRENRASHKNSGEVPPRSLLETFLPWVDLDNSRGLVVVMSGCYWDADGGAQRPVALARALSRAGFQVIYYNTDRRQSSGALTDGVFGVGPDAWTQILPTLETRRGILLPTFATYAPTVQRLRVAGWRLGYDMLDAWDKFYDAKDLHWNRDQFNVWERYLVATSDFVTCSAQGLVERAQRMGCLSPVLLRNGGPDTPFVRAPRTSERLHVVYVGHLKGSWFDWGILRDFEHALDMDITVVGDYDLGLDRGFSHVKFMGAKPYPEAMQILATGDVLIIPFQGPLSEDVDAIKLYDGWAAGVHIVVTPCMKELHNRAYVTVATPETFVDTVRSVGHALPQPDARLVRESSWTARGKLLGRYIDTTLQTTYAEPVTPVPQVRDNTFKLRVTWAGPATCNASPPCEYCCTKPDRRQRPGKLPVAAKEMQDALLQFTRCEGPCLLSVCWGEPLVDNELAEIVGALGDENRVDLVTNLMFPLQRLQSLRVKENFALCTSFHPQLWNWRTSGFIQKRRDVEDAGIHCGVTEVVAYPDWFDSLPEWFDELRSADIPVSVLPYQGRHPKTGIVYPRSYNASQWRFLKENLIVYHQDLRDSVYDGSEPCTGKMCSVGRDYVFIDWSGEILRCVIPQHSGPYSLGSIFSGWKLLDAPAPCTGTACPCADLWQFIEVEK